MKTKAIIAAGLVTLALLAGCSKEKESTTVVAPAAAPAKTPVKVIVVTPAPAPAVAPAAPVAAPAPATEDKK